MKINYADNEEFFSLGFYVDSRVLTPRNDTEALVEQVLKTIKNFPESGSELIEFSLIDVGTGSSCIPVSIIKNLKFKFNQTFALDISDDALEVAKINIEKHNLEKEIILVKSDLLENILNNNIKSNNLIITANLPYIKNGDFINMDKEVLENDPHIALFGGEKTGFELYEKLISQIIELNKKIPNIILFIEIGFDQYEYSKKYLQDLGLKFEYFKDLNNIYRVIKINFN